MGGDNQDYRFRTQYYRPQASYKIGRRPDYRLNKKQRSYKKPVISLMTIALVVVVGSAVVSAKHNPNKDKPDNSLSPVASSLTLDNMGQTINSVISNNSGIDMSVSLIDLGNDQAKNYGDSKPFLAGSTGKILTAEYFLHEVEAGRQSLGESVGGYTAQYELKQMIVVSDDTAWENLNNLLGYSNLQDYADNTFGFSDYQAYNNSLTSAGMAKALQSLWQHKALNSSDTQLLLSYLRQANYRDFIVPAVPSGDTIYHKVGLFEDDVNDAAIITHDNKAFVLVIFTDGNGDYNWPNRASMMQQITKAALKAYFNQT